MKLFPYDRLKITSELSREVILERLQKNVEPSKLIRIEFLNHKLFQGTVDDAGFKFSQISQSRTIGQPIIKGHIENDVNGRSVMVTLHLIWFKLIYLMVFVICFLTALFHGVGLVFAELTNAPSTVSYEYILGIGGLSLVFYVYFLITYKLQVKGVMKQLCALLETDDVEELEFKWVRDKGFD